MKLALSEHSQIAASAISEGSAMPCNGAKFESRSRMASLMFIAASTIALRVTPGQSAFTRILDLAYCSAAALVRPMMACRSEEHTSELQSLMRISYAVFCLKKKKNTPKNKER